MTPSVGAAPASTNAPPALARSADRLYRERRRLHALSGALPVGIFLVLHLVTNAAAIAGPEAFNAVVARLDRLPAIHWIEALLIAVPLLAHVILGIALANTAPGVGDTAPYARSWMMPVQRATGGFLVVFVIFHVWGIRLAAVPADVSPDPFSVTRRQLEHPGLFVFYALGVLSAAVHFGLGLHATLAMFGRAPRHALRTAWTAAALLATLGLHAQLAFVHPAARWLAPRAELAGGASLIAAASR